MALTLEYRIVEVKERKGDTVPSLVIITLLLTLNKTVAFCNEFCNGYAKYEVPVPHGEVLDRGPLGQKSIRTIAISY